jgi:ATP-binding cassette subfamily B protein
LSSGLINVISDVFTFIITLIVMFAIDWRLDVVEPDTLPACSSSGCGCCRYFQRKAYQKLSNKQSNLNAYIHESIAGVKTTQTFAQERTQFETFQEQQGDVRKRVDDGRAHPVPHVAWGADHLHDDHRVHLLHGHHGLRRGKRHDRRTHRLRRLCEQLLEPGDQHRQLLQSAHHLLGIPGTHLRDLDVASPRFRQAGCRNTCRRFAGKVDFNDVVFRYEDGRNILNLVDFHVEPGRTVALVGPTGAGKTTIINLLSRFYDVSEGSVTIDGYDVRDVTLQSLRQQMGVMLQDTFIFSGNVRENIRYGKLDATDEEIEAAAKAVHAHEFIMELPNGYDTVVEERGSTLSAGQRQLISFARVLLADPRILILDEATSNIDTRTEEALQAVLNHLLKGRTSFIIAHRLSTIENADEIFLHRPWTDRRAWFACRAPRFEGPTSGSTSRSIR